MLVTLLVIYVGMFLFEPQKEKDNLYKHQLFQQSTGLCDTIVSRKNEAKIFPPKPNFFNYLAARHIPWNMQEFSVSQSWIAQEIDPVKLDIRIM